MSILRRTPTRLVARRAVPWLLVADVAREGHRHWTAQLSGRERRRLIELIKRSGGRPSTLTERERRELQRLVAQLDLRTFARHAATTAVIGRAKHGRGRGR
ncbi:hypothetical protein [Patulibacter sp.]|uniref:hypothetical protein n=1 Tax=Patulibacter sp. TaxID=1912859 RepID=UPI0027222270|nr:hypothetical protein [Patulibacter sp.]MDO9407964.1 hypothetical protein [Patulibacter sp.]